MLKVDRHTKWADFAQWAPLIAGGEAERLERAAVLERYPRDRYGNEGFYTMPIGELLLILSGDQSPLLSEEGDTVFDHYRCVAFGKWVTGLIDDLARLTPPATQDEQRRTQGVLPSSFDESVYVFCRNYFALPSFSAVEDLTVGEYVMAKKDAYNIAVVDRNTAAEIRKGTKK